MIFNNDFINNSFKAEEKAFITRNERNLMDTSFYDYNKGIYVQGEEAFNETYNRYTGNKRRW